MIYKTQGIVLRFTPFRETSIIVTIFTERFGMQSYIVNGVRSSSKSTGGKIALYQPLTLLDLEVYHRDHANINRIKEVRCMHPYKTLATNITKSSIAIFLNEILGKTIKEQSSSPDLFDFLYNSLLALDNIKAGVENFHLIFMIRFSRYLGFGVHEIDPIVGLGHPNKEVERVLTQLLDIDYINSVVVTTNQRSTILELLIKFYDEHVENFGELRSLSVLREILR